jgi:hypothetical protein
MTQHEFVGISCKIHHLAWLNWVKDGRPQGLDMEYWMAAESLLLTSEGEILKDEKPQLTKTTPAHKVNSPAPTRLASRKKNHSPPHRRGSNIETSEKRIVL